MVTLQAFFGFYPWRSRLVQAPRTNALLSGLGITLGWLASGKGVRPIAAEPHSSLRVGGYLEIESGAGMKTI